MVYFTCMLLTSVGALHLFLHINEQITHSATERGCPATTDASYQFSARN